MVGAKARRALLVEEMDFHTIAPDRSSIRPPGNCLRV